MKIKKILFLVPYPQGKAPSQRFRFEQYLDVLSQNQIEYEFESFYSDKSWEILYTKNKTFQKLWLLSLCFLRRKLVLFKLQKYDFIFLHRETLPIGPPILEWLITKVFKKKIIYDFDDAIWLTDEKARWTNFLRCFWKVGLICKWSYKVSCGNDYLREYALKWNKNSFLIPTTIDLHYHKSLTDQKDKLPIIGWTGSHSTLKYLTPIIEELKKIEDKITLKVICNYNPEYNLKNYEFVTWKEKSEIEDLNKIDIGIMPLPDDEWAKGKCGFKALQYMSLKKPVILSPVGVNQKIIEEGENGFFATKAADWIEKINFLLENPDQCNVIGEKGFKTVKNHYSKEAVTSSFLNLFH